MAFLTILHLCVTLLLLLKRKVFTSSIFLYVPSPWNWKHERYSNKKYKYLQNRMMFFKGFIKIRETAAPIKKLEFFSELWSVVTKVNTRATPRRSLVFHKIDLDEDRLYMVRFFISLFHWIIPLKSYRWAWSWGEMCGRSWSLLHSHQKQRELWQPYDSSLLCYNMQSRLRR